MVFPDSFSGFRNAITPKKRSSVLADICKTVVALTGYLILYFVIIGMMEKATRVNPRLAAIIQQVHWLAPPSAPPSHSLIPPKPFPPARLTEEDIRIFTYLGVLLGLWAITHWRTLLAYLFAPAWVTFVWMIPLGLLILFLIAITSCLLSCLGSTIFMLISQCLLLIVIFLSSFVVDLYIGFYVGDRVPHSPTAHTVIFCMLSYGITYLMFPFQQLVLEQHPLTYIIIGFKMLLTILGGFAAGHARNFCIPKPNPDLNTV